jgi:hypothetical protein
MRLLSLRRGRDWRGVRGKVGRGMVVMRRGLCGDGEKMRGEERRRRRGWDGIEGGSVFYE